MGTPIVLVGGGGHCKSCIEVIESTGVWEIVGIVDACLARGENVLGYPVLGGDEVLPALSAYLDHVLIAVGQIKSAEVRNKLFRLVLASGFSLPVIVASTAHVSRHAKAGAGTVILHGAFVNAGASIGENCIINSGSIIEHDAIVERDCHVSTGAIVNGNCRVGEGSFIGSGVVLRNGIKIGNHVVLGAGSTGTRDIIESGVYAGCPARKIE